MNKRTRGEKIKLASYDDLFGTEETTISPVDQKLYGQIVEVPLDELHTFKNHPFRVVDYESMEEMVESIREYGVLVPSLAIPRTEGGYELISGHRRQHASRLAGKDKMPVIIKELQICGIQTRVVSELRIWMI